MKGIFLLSYTHLPFCHLLFFLRRLVWRIMEGRNGLSPSLPHRWWAGRRGWAYSFVFILKREKTDHDMSLLYSMLSEVFPSKGITIQFNRPENENMHERRFSFGINVGIHSFFFSAGFNEIFLALLITFWSSKEVSVNEDARRRKKGMKNEKIN